MKYTLFLLLTLVFITTCTSEIEQMKQLSQKIFTVQQNEKYMTNLFLKYNEVIIKSRIYYVKNRKQTTLAHHQIQLILQHDYWQMYKKKLSPILKFNLTQQIITAIQSNSTFLQTTVYVIIKHSKHQIDKQTIPLMRNFSHIGREGIQNWMIADQQLLETQPDQQMVLSHQDFYFFQFDWQLPFSTKTNHKTEGYGVYKDTDISYYYPLPLSKDINTKLKQNYTPLSNLKQGELFTLKVRIKLAGYMYPLFLYAKQRQQQFPQSPLYQFKDIDQDLFDHRVVVFWPYLYRFIKNVILQGSVLSWLIFIWSGIAVLSSTSVAILSLFFQYRIFKFAEEYRGMSLYSLLLVLVLNLVILIGGLISDTNDQVTLAFFMVLFTWWKIRQIATVKFSLQSPFVKIKGQNWYKTYQQKDWSIFINTLPFILIFMILVTFYPFLVQNYMDQTGLNWSEDVRNYILERLITSIDKYLLIFTLIIQILLNYQLKSCNSMTWKLIITLMVYFSVDNSMVLVTPSFTDLLYWLKEDIFLFILIVQKLVYGNNLQNMKIPIIKEQNNNQEEANQQEKLKQEQQQKIQTQNKQNQFIISEKQHIAEPSDDKNQDLKQKKQ